MTFGEAYALPGVTELAGVVALLVIALFCGYLLQRRSPGVGVRSIAWLGAAQNRFHPFNQQAL